ATPAPVSFSSDPYADHLDPHSFPTRRSSDLVNADKVAHGLYEVNPSLVREVARAFGDDVLRQDGTLDRARLGRIVFGSASALERSEEHTSELQSRENLVCRLLLEKNKKQTAG